jgi:plasmid maintenance system antidote protein VapI
MEEYNWTHAHVAALMGVPEQWVGEFLLGKQPITPDVALNLENLTKIAAGFWIRLQAQYLKPLPVRF